MADYEANIAPFINDTFYLTSPYGIDRGSHIHVGVDLATPNGSPLYSMVKGKIIANEFNRERGWIVIMKDDETGIAFLYQHLREASPLNVGDNIDIGDYVGFEGTTGTSTGIHLHIEMQNLSNRNWYFGNDISYYMNPCEFMGFPNETGISIIYNGSPKPYKKKQNKWLMSRSKKFLIFT